MGQRSSSLDEPIDTQQLTPAGERIVVRHPSCKYLSIVRTVVGLITVFACWSLGVNSITSTQYLWLGVFLIIVAIPITLLEFSFVIDKVACCGEQGFCCQMWHVILWLDSWKRGICYSVLAVITFALAPKYVLSILCGISMLTCAILYFAKPWQFKKEALYTVSDRPPKPDSQNSGPAIQDPSGAP